MTIPYVWKSNLSPREKSTSYESPTLPISTQPLSPSPRHIKSRHGFDFSNSGWMAVSSVSKPSR